MGHDAFGRDEGEDPITAMGWARPAGSPAPKSMEAVQRVATTTRRETVSSAFSQGDTTNAARSAPAVKATQASSAFGAVTAVTSVARSRRAAQRATGRPSGFRLPFGGLIRLAILLAILWAIFGDTARDAVRDVRDTIEEVDSTSSTPLLPEAARPEQADPDAKPFTTRAGLAPVLGQMRELAPGRPVFVSVREERVDVQVLTGPGRLTLLSAVRGRDAQVTTTTDAAATPATFAWSAVDPAAPSRLRRTIGGFSSAALVKGGELMWSVVTDGQGIWTARADGRGAERVGG